ncbi:MAG TPA: DUF2911 domain-containing protein [Myxococcota bacterium]|nr:DUF2911 domain-containing protein [Myxococcota bacterium]
MKKKILAGFGVIVFAFLAFVAWALLIGNKRSPAATVTHDPVSVTYCRPYKKGRVIFGDDDALVPNGRYWRLGANAATEITFAKDVKLAGQPVQAGQYVMYAVPNATTWKVVLNSENGRWGAREVDHDKDVLTVEVPVEHVTEPLEQFTITVDDNGLILAWDTTVVRVPITST